MSIHVQSFVNILNLSKYKEVQLPDHMFKSMLGPKDLNVRLETIKLLEENRQTTLWYKSQQDPRWPTSQSSGNKNQQRGPNET